MSGIPWPVIALAGLLGLVIGSFLNVVIYRVPRQESLVSPPSHCPQCLAEIKAWHNIPVLSWVLLRGRCAFCGLRISARYPLVEAGTAALFVGLTLRFGLTVELPAFLYLAAIGVTLAMIEFDVRLLPDSILMPSYIVALALLMPAGAERTDGGEAARGLAGMAALTVLLFAFAIAFPNALGFADVKLAGLFGLYLAWLSWEALFIGAVGTLLIAAVGGRAAVVTGRAQRTVVFPLGPSLIASSVLAVFIAVPLVSWYGALLTV